MSIVILNETLDRATRRLSGFVDPSTGHYSDMNSAQE